LLREMNHRVKNLFSVAVSVLRLSGRSAGSVPELIDSTSDRLSALALTLASGLGDLSQAAKPTTLHSLIQAITAPPDVPGDSDASKFSVTGCDMEITTSAISNLALLLNEFATNATKYGALSTTAGRIRIQCANQGRPSSLPGQSVEAPKSYLSPPPVSPRDHQARRLALCALHSAIATSKICSRSAALVHGYADAVS
jgi:two-component sensor histidine kinase